LVGEFEGDWRGEDLQPSGSKPLCGSAGGNAAATIGTCLGTGLPP